MTEDKNNKEGDSMNTVPLTERQLEVARLAGQGWSNLQIGDHLGIQYNTVKAHLSLAMKLLGVNKRTQLVEALEKIGVEVPISDFNPKPATRTLRPIEVVLLNELRKGKTLPQFADDHDMPLHEVKTVLKTLYNLTGCMRMVHLLRWADKFLKDEEKYWN